MNVNGQNGVATSALKNAVVKAVKMINKAEIGKRTYVKIDEDMRLSFDGIRFIRGAKDNFIFNGKIEKKASNGRYDNVFVEIHYKNLDNEEGLCLNDMINGVLDDILNDIDNWIIDYYKSESSSKWADGLEMYQNFRNKFFGSILVVDNTEDLNSPDALIGFENASEECDGNMMACVDKYGQEFIDGVIKEYADTVYNAVSDYDLDDTINYCVKGALDYMEYDPDKKRLVGCSDVPDLGNWDDEEEFCNYFEDAYSFDWDSCQEFYQTYCNDIWHFADEYDDRMEDALRDFEKESIFDKMPYTINYNEGYINVYIDMDDFVDYIKKNMVFNADKAQLHKYNDMGIILYNMFDSDNVDVDKHFKDLNYSWLFCRDLENMLPMVTDVKLYDDGLYLWYKDITDMTIREFYELHNDGYGCTEDPINNYVDEFLRPDAVKTFFNLVEKDEDWIFYIEEDDGGDLSVLGNEGIFERYFNDDVPMVQVYSYLMDKMNKEIIKIEKEIEKEIEGAEYKVLDAFEITDAQGKNSFNVDYDEWWDYVLGETPDWIKDKYFDKFCDVLYNYFVKFAKDYDYGVEEIDGGISLEKPDYNN